MCFTKRKTKPNKGGIDRNITLKGGHFVLKAGGYGNEYNRVVLTCLKFAIVIG